MDDRTKDVHDKLNQKATFHLKLSDSLGFFDADWKNACRAVEMDLKAAGYVKSRMVTLKTRKREYLWRGDSFNDFFRAVTTSIMENQSVFMEECNERDICEGAMHNDPMHTQIGKWVLCAIL